MKVKLNNVRLAFPQLWKAQAINDGDPTFGANFIIEPVSENAKELTKAVKEVAKEKWKGKAGQIHKKLQNDDRICYHTEPMTNSEGDIYDGFEDAHWLRSSNKARPTILDRDKSPLIESDGRPYAGCYVNAVIDIWPQDNQYGKRINATLMGVQFLEDGDAFTGGGVASEDDFDDFGIDDDDDLFGEDEDEAA